MEWIAIAFMTILAIVLHSPSEPEKKEKTESEKRQDISTKC